MKRNMPMSKRSRTTAQNLEQRFDAGDDVSDYFDFSKATRPGRKPSGKANRQSAPKFGARVYPLGGKLLVKQTILRGTPPEYVIDEQKERHVSDGDDKAIAKAIRDAVSGKL
jgi:hypothetical protein